LFKQLKESRNYFKQLLKTVHPVLKTKESEQFWKHDTIIDKGFHALIPESKPTKDGMEGYSKFVNGELL
jgi:hypothetical protein